MKKYKKLFQMFIFVLIVVFALSACGKDSEGLKLEDKEQTITNYANIDGKNGEKDIGMLSDKIKDGDFTEDQKKSLNSFRKIDDYPVYIMNYYGDYELSDYLKKGKQIKDSANTQYIGDEEKIYDACSCIAALNDEGEKLLGRNLDYYPSPKLVLYTNPPDGYASISVLDLRHIGLYTEEDIENITSDDLKKLLYAPYIPLDGMNEYGVAIGEMTAYGSIAPTDPKKITLGDVTAIRLVLDYAKTVDEAVELLGKYNIYFPPAPPMHFLISDKTGKSVVIEYLKGEMVVIPNENPWQVSTNFIIHESSESTRNSCRRYSTAQRVMSEKDGKVSEKEMMNLLEEVSQFSTCYSAVFNMNTGKISLSIGRKYNDEDIKHFELEMK